MPDRVEPMLRAYRGDTACLRGSVGWLAGHRVKEEDGTPRFVKWTPNPFAASPRPGLKPASDDLAYRVMAYAPMSIISQPTPAPIWAPRQPI
jgi:hypothetical protein